MFAALRLPDGLTHCGCVNTLSQERVASGQLLIMDSGEAIHGLYQPIRRLDT